MAITKYLPRTVLLGGPDGGHAIIVNDLKAVESITPGMLVRRSSAGGTPVFRKAFTAAEATAPRSVALNASMLNRGVDTPYVSGELIEVGILGPGATAWMLIASGAAAVIAGDFLESAGDGTLRKGNAAIFMALENTDNSTGALGAPGRIKAEAL